MVPSVLGGRYELEELIGRGGMGEVWRGRDLRGHRPVAVKILAPQVAGLSARERFAREARAAARVVHPNVVTVLDVGEHDARPYLVMELLSGRSLAEDLDERGRYGVAEACDLVSQAAAGLDAAHRVGVVHRDVKPANLHRTANGVLKVVDFGVAHVATEAARLTMAGTVVGTAAYLAPEQITGQSGDAASDLYALGCVCYELLCGSPPFTGSAPQLVYRHLHEAPVPPSRHRPDVPAELDRLVLALLAKDPAARPAGAEIVRQVLAAIAFPPPQAQAARGASEERRVPYAGGARAGDTALLAAPPGTAPVGRPGGSPERRMLIRLGAAVAALAVVTLGVAALSDSGGGQAGSAASSPEPSRPPKPTVTAVAEVTASAVPTPTPTRSPSAQRSPTPAATPSRRPVYRSYQEWLAAFDRAVQRQELLGGIDPRLAHRAHDTIRKAARDLVERRDRGEKGAKRIRELARDLRKAHREGRLAGGPLVDFLNAAGLSGREDDD